MRMNRTRASYCLNCFLASSAMDASAYSTTNQWKCAHYQGLYRTVLVNLRIICNRLVSCGWTSQPILHSPAYIDFLPSQCAPHSTENLIGVDSLYHGFTFMQYFLFVTWNQNKDTQQHKITILLRIFIYCIRFIAIFCSIHTQKIK